jgi:hypothetical protein
MNATSDAAPNGRRHGASTPVEPFPAPVALTDEELVWSLLADLGDATVDLPIEQGLVVVEVFNLVAEVARPRRLVTDPTRSIPELVDQACAVLGRLADAATRTSLVARYVAANLQLRDLADQLALDRDHDRDDRPGRRSRPS